MLSLQEIEAHFLNNKTLLNVLLYLQVAYAIWQFIRVAKFCRLPYITLSVLWNGGYHRTFFSSEEETSVLSEVLQPSNVLLQDPPADVVLTSYGHNCYLVESDRFNLVLQAGQVNNLKIYLETRERCVKDVIPLVPGIDLARKVYLNEALDHIISGKSIVRRRSRLVMDHTSSDCLNVNFMRILSLFPLVLQAKHRDFYSALASICLTLMDLWSIPCNWMWRRFKLAFQYYTKRALSYLPKRLRVILFHLISTGSMGFMYCDRYIQNVYFKGFDYIFIQTGFKINFGFDFEFIDPRVFQEEVVMKPLVVPAFGRVCEYTWNGATLQVRRQDKVDLMGPSHRLTYYGETFTIHVHDYLFEQYMYSFYDFISEHNIILLSGLQGKSSHWTNLLTEIQNMDWRITFLRPLKRVTLFVSDHKLVVGKRF